MNYFQEKPNTVGRLSSAIETMEFIRKRFLAKYEEKLRAQFAECYSNFNIKVERHQDDKSIEALFGEFTNFVGRYNKDYAADLHQEILNEKRKYFDLFITFKSSRESESKERPNSNRKISDEWIDFIK